MNTCEMLSEFFSDYVEGALRPEEIERLESHLAGCVECRSIVARLQSLRGQLRHLSVVKTAPNFDMLLQARLMMDRRTRRSSMLPAFNLAFGDAWKFSTVGVMLVVISVSFLFWRNQNPVEAAASTVTAFRVPGYHSSSASPPPTQQAEILYSLDKIAPPLPVIYKAPTPVRARADSASAAAADSRASKQLKTVSF